MGYIIPPASSGCPPIWTCPEDLQREAPRKRPYTMPVSSIYQGYEPSPPFPTSDCRLCVSQPLAGYSRHPSPQQHFPGPPGVPEAFMGQMGLKIPPASSGSTPGSPGRREAPKKHPESDTWTTLSLLQTPDPILTTQSFWLKVRVGTQLDR